MRGKIERYDSTRVLIRMDEAHDFSKWLDKDLDIDIKIHREKKSNEQVNYVWELLYELSKRTKKPRERLYLEEIEKYGQFTYLAIPIEEEKKIRPLFRVVKNRGRVNLTTESGRVVECSQLQCFKGLSDYNTEECALLIDGILEDIKEWDEDENT